MTHLNHLSLRLSACPPPPGPGPRSMLGAETVPWCRGRSSHRVYHVSQLDYETQALVNSTLPWPLRENPSR